MTPAPRRTYLPRCACHDFARHVPCSTCGSNPNRFFSDRACVHPESPHLWEDTRDVTWTRPLRPDELKQLVETLDERRPDAD